MLAKAIDSKQVELHRKFIDEQVAGLWRAKIGPILKLKTDYRCP